MLCVQLRTHTNRNWTDSTKFWGLWYQTAFNLQYIARSCNKTTYSHTHRQKNKHEYSSSNTSRCSAFKGRIHLTTICWWWEIKIVYYNKLVETGLSVNNQKHYLADENTNIVSLCIHIVLICSQIGSSVLWMKHWTQFMSYFAKLIESKVFYWGFIHSVNL